MDIQELIVKIYDLKESSKEIAQFCMQGSEFLNSNASMIFSLTRGNSTGMRASQQVTQTARSLRQTTLTIQRLEGELEQYLKKIGQ